MKKGFRSIGLVLLLISPLFSALLTDNLEVVSPTGLHLTYDSNELVNCRSGINNTLTIRFIETPLGVSLVREYAKSGVVQVSRPISNPKATLIIIKFSSGEVSERRIMKTNVILK